MVLSKNIKYLKNLILDHIIYVSAFSAESLYWSPENQVCVVMFNPVLEYTGWAGSN
jgi:hypothetical protein